MPRPLGLVVLVSLLIGQALAFPSQENQNLVRRGDECACSTVKCNKVTETKKFCECVNKILLKCNRVTPKGCPEEKLIMCDRPYDRAKVLASQKPQTRTSFDPGFAQATQTAPPVPANRQAAKSVAGAGAGLPPSNSAGLASGQAFASAPPPGQTPDPPRRSSAAVAAPTDSAPPTASDYMAVPVGVANRVKTASFDDNIPNASASVVPPVAPDLASSASSTKPTAALPPPPTATHIPGIDDLMPTVTSSPAAPGTDLDIPTGTVIPDIASQVPDGGAPRPQPTQAEPDALVPTQTVGFDPADITMAQQKPSSMAAPAAGEIPPVATFSFDPDMIGLPPQKRVRRVVYRSADVSSNRNVFRQARDEPEPRSVMLIE